MTTSDRRAVYALLQLLWGVMILLGVAFAVGTQNPWIALFAAAGVLATALQTWWLLAADHWRGFRPPSGTTFERNAQELPVLADHRDVFGPGQPRNVVRTRGSIAFELVRGARRRWFYVVPLARAHTPWHVRPESTSPSALGSPRGDLRRLYDATGRVPEAVAETLLGDPLAEVELRVVDDLLIATASGMSGHRFSEWSRREGTLVRRIATVLDAQPEPETRALPARLDPRNRWQPEAPASDAVWAQPPTAPVRRP